MYSGSSPKFFFQSFVTEHSIGLMTEYTPVTAGSYRRRLGSQPLVKIFVSNEDSNASKMFNRFGDFARRNPKQLFTFADISKNRQDVEEFKVEAGGYVIETADTQYVKRGVDISTSTLEEFLKEFVAGTAQPYVKSEEIPASNDGPVTVVVGKTFDSLVTNVDKDVLLEFYAP